MPLLFKIGDNIMAKACTHCNSTPDVPFAVLEANEARHERREIKLWVLILVLVFFLVGTNVAWLVYESQFVETETSEEIIVDADDNGIANYIGNNGDIINGEDYNSKEN
jgi:hypothetical protein